MSVGGSQPEPARKGKKADKGASKALRNLKVVIEPGYMRFVQRGAHDNESKKRDILKNIDRKDKEKRKRGEELTANPG